MPRRPLVNKTTENMDANWSASSWHNSVLPVPEGPTISPAPSPRSIDRVSVLRAFSIAVAGK